MADKSGQMFEIPKRTSLVADLFTTQEQRDDAKREKVLDIPLAEIDDFPDHPFQVKNDESMQSMVESIKAVGIQTPAIVRRKEDSRYELVSGHRRKLAAELAGLETMPVIVRQLNRDEAIIAMVDANLQREVILPSEKAFAYKMKMEAIRRQAGRPSKDNLRPVGANLIGTRSDELLASNSDDSARQIQRYINLTNLSPELLHLMDDGKIAMRPAVELSHLPEEHQRAVLAAIESEDCTPSHVQAMKLRRFSEEGKLNEDVITSIMQEEKPNQVEQFKISRDKLNKYFSPGTSAQKMEETIIKALELWRKREMNRDAR